MAALIGDSFSDSLRFHNMIAGPGEHYHPHRSASRSQDREREREPPPPSHLQRQDSPARVGARYHSRDLDAATTAAANDERTPAQEATDADATSADASKLPSPPSSSSSSTALSSAAAPPNYVTNPPLSPAADTASSAVDVAQAPNFAAMTSTTPSSSIRTATLPPQPLCLRPLIPSPDSDCDARRAQLPGRDISRAAEMTDATPTSGSTTGTTTPAAQSQPTVVQIRDLAHIESLVRSQRMTGSRTGAQTDPSQQRMKYEISTMPIGDVIEMVAALLTKITTNNDAENKAQNRNAAHMKQIQAAQQQLLQAAKSPASAAAGEDDITIASSMSPLASCVLAFHGKNVPAITILSYLSRIHKYCPTTFEVFLSLLVYFDRMSEQVNQLVMQDKEERIQQQEQTAECCSAPSSIPQPIAPPQALTDTDTVMRDGDGDESGDSDESDSDLADDDDIDEEDDKEAGQSPTASVGDVVPGLTPTADTALEPTFFVVDSFNIHRLIIAGVTCASKFFSDVFYTNSRYAKVGGLPLPELNHLELQFLHLNDFRLAVPVESLEAYATMLVEFYAREVVAPKSHPSTEIK